MIALLALFIFLIGSLFMIIGAVLGYEGIFDISCYDYAEGAAYIFGAILLFGLGMLSFWGCNALCNATTNSANSLVSVEEYETITSKLEDNPFDKEAIHDAILYNHKVVAAKELDDLGSKNEYEDYINEPEIDFDTYQINYIDENFDLKELMEKLENKKE